jgi:hypothetical protein
MVLVLGLGSHDEELAEETADVAEAREIVGLGAACVAIDLVHGAEEGLAAMGDAVRDRQRGSRGGDGDGARDGCCGLSARGSVAEIGMGVGAEKGEDEEGGEALDDPAGFVEAEHLARRGCGVAGRGTCARVGEFGHGSFTLGTASHGWVMGGAGFCEIQGSLRCGASARLRSR